MRRSVVRVCVWLAVTAVAACGGASGTTPADDRDADTGDTAEADTPETTACTTHDECTGTWICRDGVCAEPRYPKINPDAYVNISTEDPNGNSIVNARRVKSYAPTIKVGTHPTNIELSPDGRLLAVNENGFGTAWDRAVEDRFEHLVRIFDAADLTLKQRLRLPNRSSYFGLRWSSDGRHLYVAGGRDNAVHRFVRGADDTLGFDRSFNVGDCFTTDVVLHPDGSRMYVTCELQRVMAVWSFSEDRTIDRVTTLRDPYRLQMAPDGKYVYLVHWATATRPRPADTVIAIDTAIDRNAGSWQAGLGPNGLFLTADGTKLYAAASNSDELYEFDARAITTLNRISLHEDENPPKGKTPTSVSVSPDGTRAYLTLANDNAIQIIDLPTKSIKGYIPTEWYPTDTALSADGRTLYVLTMKGTGDGPTNKYGDAVGRQHPGSLTKFVIPDDAALPALTAEVVANDTHQQRYFTFDGPHDLPISAFLGEKTSPIEHVILFMKENFTYDAAYGTLDKGDGDPRFALWNERVIPNQFVMAREWALFDRFFCDSQSSIEGHQWGAAAICTDHTVKHWVMNYGGWGLPEVRVSLDPGTVQESQYFLPHMINNGFTVRSYGAPEHFGPEILGKYRDVYYPVAKWPFLPDPNVTDKWRAGLFIEEFEQLVAEGKWPNMVHVNLGNNHGFGLGANVPTPESSVADNDEGLAMMIDAIAKSPIWPKCLIVIQEDDSQYGYDHVDTHRSPVILMGPWIKRNYLSSVHYSMPNVHKTIEMIFNVPPMTRNDQTAAAMYDAFSAKPDFRPFVMKPRAWPVERNGDRVVPAALKAASEREDWSTIDAGYDVAELYWKWRRGDEPVPEVRRRFGAPMSLPETMSGRDDD